MIDDSPQLMPSELRISYWDETKVIKSKAKSDSLARQEGKIKYNTEHGSSVD